jgi:transcriptional regulator with XRE-family HTH domain
MDEAVSTEPDINHRIAQRLRELRSHNGWSLDGLAERSGVSRATLSRLENAEVSPTAQVLGRLCAAFGMTLSRLMAMVEKSFTPLIGREAQAVWVDPESRFRRRVVSPPAQQLAGEVIEGELPAGVRIAYERPPRPGLEHHLVMLEGELEVTADRASHALRSGDCLRYRLHGASSFTTPQNLGARYLIFMV